MSDHAADDNDKLCGLSLSLGQDWAFGLSYTYDHLVHYRMILLLRYKTFMRTESLEKNGFTS